MSCYQPISLAIIRVSRLPGARQHGKLLAGGLRLACALGPRGIVHNKREGDGATPAGRFLLERALLRRDRLPRPRTALPLRSLRRDDGWCDDAASGRYNRPVRLPCPAGCERLWRDDCLYDVLIALDHNRRPRIRGLGSAIFLHVARPDGAPTAGCVAISADDMRRLLPRLSARTVLVIG